MSIDGNAIHQNCGGSGSAWTSSPSIPARAEANGSPRLSGGEIESINPADGSAIAKVQLAGPREYDHVVNQAAAAFASWRMMPAPKRGEIVREIGDELRATRPTWARWSRSRWARSSPKAWAKCRR